MAAPARAPSLARSCKGPSSSPRPGGRTRDVGIRRVVLALALAAWTGAAAEAQDSEDFMRPCRRGDLVGHWQVIRSGSAGGLRVDRSDPVHQPHQRYVFKPN